MFYHEDQRAVSWADRVSKGCLNPLRGQEQDDQIAHLSHLDPAPDAGQYPL